MIFKPLLRGSRTNDDGRPGREILVTVLPPIRSPSSCARLSPTDTVPLREESDISGCGAGGRYGRGADVGESPRLLGPEVFRGRGWTRVFAGRSKQKLNEFDRLLISRYCHGEIKIQNW